MENLFRKKWFNSEIEFKRHNAKPRFIMGWDGCVEEYKSYKPPEPTWCTSVSSVSQMATSSSTDCYDYYRSGNALRGDYGVNYFYMPQKPMKKRVIKD